jgi:uncharacterized peroxidase-related enzyme
MKTIQVPTREQVSPESQVLFDTLQKRQGRVANLYATMGYSSHALKGFMDLEETIYKGVFTGKEREAVALIVSQINGCEYCLAGHTVLAIKRGYTKELTLSIRRGQVEDTRLNAIIQLAQSIAENKGKAEQVYIDNFFDAGFDEAALMELVGLVVIRTFTNYVFALTKIPIDAPLADPI